MSAVANTQRRAIQIYLVNPRNPVVALVRQRENRLNKYRIWKPLGLLVLARATPPDCEVTVIDENLHVPDYAALPRPDLVGLTAFTSQASRAYELAARFRATGVTVVMGGIHASMCVDEALTHVDSVVAGEADEVWPDVVNDFRGGRLQRVYEPAIPDIDKVPQARHDLLPSGYAFGSIQTTRGCPLDCSYCSVTSFNGRRFRWRPIEQVIEEFKLVKEKYVLIVDDNLIGTSRRDIARAKALFRAMIAAGLDKRWICQVTVNMGEDEELVRLAAGAGCVGAFVGFETPTPEGLVEINKRFNMRKGIDFRASCRCMQRYGIAVHGAFIIGLDADESGVGRRIVDAATAYGVDSINVTIMTPLPGTRLWDRMRTDGRIAADAFPEDWKYYTLAFPVARYRNFTWTELIDEWLSCLAGFYAYPRIAARFFRSAFRMRRPFPVFSSLITNLVYRRNVALDRATFASFDTSRGSRYVETRRRPVDTVLPMRPTGQPGPSPLTRASPAHDETG